MSVEVPPELAELPEISIIEPLEEIEAREREEEEKLRYVRVRVCICMTRNTI